MAKDLTRDKLVRLVAERQGLTTEDLSRLTGVTRQRVHLILRNLGYEVRCVWSLPARRGGGRA